MVGFETFKGGGRGILSGILFPLKLFSCFTWYECMYYLGLSEVLLIVFGF